MTKIHFHRWEEFELFGSSSDDIGVYMTTYRYCKCGKWQKQMGTYEKNWWEECENPEINKEKTNKEYNVGE